MGPIIESGGSNTLTHSIYQHIAISQMKPKRFGLSAVRQAQHQRLVFVNPQQHVLSRHMH